MGYRLLDNVGQRGFLHGMFENPLDPDIARLKDGASAGNISHKNPGVVRPCPVTEFLRGNEQTNNQLYRCTLGSFVQEPPIVR